MLEHGVEDDEQFAHTRDQGHLLRFTMRQRPLVEVADGGLRTASPCRVGSPQLTAQRTSEAMAATTTTTTGPLSVARSALLSPVTPIRPCPSCPACQKND